MVRWVLCATGVRSRGAVLGAAQHRAGKRLHSAILPLLEWLRDSFGSDVHVLALMGLQLEQLSAGGVTKRPVAVRGSV